MSGGAQQLIQTILTIRGLQQQDAAAALAREQFGLAKAATGEQMLGHIGALASSLPDPKVLLPHIESIASRTGLDPETLQTIFSNATPTESVTKSKVLARGVESAGTALDQPAAYSNLVGAQPGQLEMDDLNKLIFQGAHQYIGALPPEQRKTFNAGVATKVGMGQTLGEALNDEIFSHLPKDQQAEAIRIGKGLAPNAGEIIQARLGAGNLALQQNVAAANAAYQTMQASAAMAEANARLQGKQKDDAIQLIKQIADFQQFLTKNSGTFTEEGQLQHTASLNAMYKELQKIDPHIGSLYEPVDITKPLSATSPFGAFMQKLRQK